jgi:hypothetical protein
MPAMMQGTHRADPKCVGRKLLLGLITAARAFAVAYLLSAKVISAGRSRPPFAGMEALEPSRAATASNGAMTQHPVQLVVQNP